MTGEQMGTVGEWHWSNELPVVASTTAGEFRARENAGVLAFRGIRYAMADRFAAAVPAPIESELVDAGTWGPECPQVPGGYGTLIGFGVEPRERSEDCLRLNVFTPACDSQKRPVMVWIHGGAFVHGSSSNAWYEGFHLARKGDVVVVSINYRVGLLGFLGEENAGIGDQILALQWVQRHIESFGGDPENVTVFGQSAGGSSIGVLLGTPIASELFARAVMMSSPSLDILLSRETATETQRLVLERAGVPGVESLHGASADDIVRLQTAVIGDEAVGLPPRRNALALQVGPVKGGRWVSETPTTDAAASDVPVLMGFTTDEFMLGQIFEAADHGDPAAVFDQLFPGQGAKALELYRGIREGASRRRLITAAVSDKFIAAPTLSLAESRAAEGNATWLYEFSWASPIFGGRMGAGHSVELPFAFGTIDAPYVERFIGDGEDRAAVAQSFSQALLSFARSGDPGWREYEPTERMRMRFDTESTVVSDHCPALRRLLTQT